MASAETEPKQVVIHHPPLPAKSLVFKLGKEVTNHVRIFLKARGWEECTSEDEKGEWNLIWQDRLYDDSRHASALPQQRLNHFQNTRGICRKDMLAMNFARLKAVFGLELLDFIPTTFILPQEKDQFVQFVAAAGTRSLWICKPSASARGKGIFVFDDLKSFWGEASLPCVVQSYIPRPLTVGGYKFDLRLYCLLTSAWPLKCYLHTKGLVRFSSQKYDLTSLSNRFSHLTNFSINKAAPKRMLSAEDERVLGQGCKWTLEQLWVELGLRGFNVARIWRNIRRLVLLTLLPLVGEVPHDPHCYELLGFDVLLDTSGKAWLLEVNRSPAMACSTVPDKTVKKVVLADMFHLVGLDSPSILGGKLCPLPEGVARETGGFEQLFPFNEQTEAANAALVSCEASPPPTLKERSPGVLATLNVPVKNFLAVAMANLTEQLHADRLLDEQEAEEDGQDVDDE
jgi:tubulin polyglutamylase TTLL2